MLFFNVFTPLETIQWTNSGADNFFRLLWGQSKTYKNMFVVGNIYFFVGYAVISMAVADSR